MRHSGSSPRPCRWTQKLTWTMLSIGMANFLGARVTGSCSKEEGITAADSLISDSNTELRLRAKVHARVSLPEIAHSMFLSDSALPA